MPALPVWRRNRRSNDTHPDPSAASWSGTSGSTDRGSAREAPDFRAAAEAEGFTAAPVTHRRHCPLPHMCQLSSPNGFMNATHGFNHAFRCN